ncbi:MAG: hypothetical protein J5880_01965 [Bacilli bacterium]|nr:hypothetical protein [Bacilli bacterium]MBO4682916.1 hypothetical protein [Bacilli bacterium]
MSQTGYLIIAISIMVVLLIVFFVSFVLYRKTPVPKGCEDIMASEEKCASCSNKTCQFNKGREE